MVPPIGAQGLNMSLADIATLLDLCLPPGRPATTSAVPRCSPAITAPGTADLVSRVAGIDALNRAAMAGARPLRDMRRVALQALAATPPLRRTAMRLGLGSGRGA